MQFSTAAGLRDGPAGPAQGPMPCGALHGRFEPNHVVRS